jgi:hypothetical protein
LYQTKFWIDISIKLKFYKKETLIICFDTESQNLLLKKNVKHFFIKSNINDNKNIIKGIFKRYNSINYKTVLKHEEFFYGKRNFFKILKKFLTYIAQIEDLFLSLKHKQITLIQELSGFSSSLSLYYVSKKFKRNNYFIEPSFFDGRFHITLNTLMCHPITNNKISKKINILQIINKIKNLKKIIIPKKDVSHFLNPFNKIFNFINIIRFFEKLFKAYWIQRQVAQLLYLKFFNPFSMNSTLYLAIPNIFEHHQLTTVFVLQISSTGILVHSQHLHRAALLLWRRQIALATSTSLDHFLDMSPLLFL